MLLIACFVRVRSWLDMYTYCIDYIRRALVFISQEDNYNTLLWAAFSEAYNTAGECE